MAGNNIPHGREKRVTSSSKGVSRRGDGLHMGGPVGNAGGYSDRGVSGGGPRRSSGGGRGGLIGIIFAILVALGGGGSLLGGMGGGSSVDNTSPAQTASQSTTQNMGNLFSGYHFSNTGSGWVLPSNNGKLNTDVAENVPQKRTRILGNGQDQVTIMVYMCGTDLESKSGMATSDLQEMANATLNDKVNILVYTGGCKGWKNNIISSRTNQIYQIKNGGLVCLEKDMGSSPMTDYRNLETFLAYGKKNFPANRMDLIFWDHGGGSVSGYGYDELYPRNGGMSLANINTALKNSGMDFDFIGFDACLMATMENALMLSNYADYLIASEESEPGYGWYYTDWLTNLAANPSMPTIEIGKQIADDFVRVCTQKGQGSITTLSVTDLAEIGAYGPEAMTAFSKSATELIAKEEYKQVATARTSAKEFARSSGIDQVDLAHLAFNMDTDGGKALADVICNAVKYNRVADNISNAYGLSIYFPYKKASYVDSAVATYDAIGMDDEYARCIQEFASVETAGQVASGGTTNPLGSLLGSGSASSQGASPDVLLQVLTSLMGGSYEGIAGLTSGNTNFLSGRSLEDYASYVGKNQFDASALLWQQEDGNNVIALSEEQWDLVTALELNVFYDDGTGYIDLGLDNVYEFTEDGALLGNYDRTWLAIDGQPVAYYFLEEEEDGEHYSITGRVPAMLNGNRVDLILIFNSENPYGYIEGARYYYAENETEMVAKDLETLKPGDQLDFLCDYYSYDGEFMDNYYLGETLTVGDTIEISNVDVGDGAVQATYRFTDIYNQHYWTGPMQ